MHKTSPYEIVKRFASGFEMEKFILPHNTEYQLGEFQKERLRECRYLFREDAEVDALYFKAPL